LRLVRLMKAFRELRVLCFTIAAGMNALLWSGILVGTIEAIAAILLTMLLADSLKDETLTDETRLFIWKYFGTFSRSWFTMFEATFSTWHKVARPMIEDVSPLFALFWIPYTVMVVFVIMRIVGAIFIKETFATSSRVQAMEVQAIVDEQPVDVLRDILEKYDDDFDGVLHKEEFLAAMQDKDLQRWLAELQIEPDRMKGLYELCDSGDGAMSLEEFLACTLALAIEGGENVDTVTLMYETQRVITWVQVLEKQMLESLHMQRRIIDDIEGREARNQQLEAEVARARTLGIPDHDVKTAMEPSMVTTPVAPVREKLQFPTQL